jgi:hypothetical protein
MINHKRSRICFKFCVFDMFQVEPQLNTSESCVIIHLSTSSSVMIRCRRRGAAIFDHSAVEELYFWIRPKILCERKSRR